MFDSSYKTAQLPHPSSRRPSSIHEKNGRNTRISHATLPRVKLSLKPRKLACRFQYSPVRSCRRDHAASASSTARNAPRTGSATTRDATIVDSLLRTRQPPAETRWTPWNLEPKSETDPLLAPFVSVEAAAATSANGSPCRTNEPWKNDRHSWPTNVKFIRGILVRGFLRFRE